MSKAISITKTIIESKIYLIRGQKVMLDSDLAEMYGVET
jgi:ORF6N domain